MTNRQNVLKALRREKPENIPFEFTLSPAHVEELEKKIGTRDYQSYFHFPVRCVELNDTRKKTDFSAYYKNLPPGAEPLHWCKEWGIIGVSGAVAHFQHMLHPMTDFEEIGQIDAYPFPDLNEDYRWQGISEKVKRLKDSDLIVAAEMQMTIFETAWYLRGMDEFMVDLMVNEEFAGALLDKITEIRIGMAKRYAKSGFDILKLGDDVSTQLDMMLSPDLWRRMIKPRLTEIIKAAKDHKPDMLVFYHGDGNLQKIIPDLIETGVDILNPVQPECMDPVKIKKIYGDRLSFWGTIGTQTVLPFGTPQEVKDECRRMIENVGAEGGLLLAPTHVVEPEVPFENIQAFIEAVKEYGA